jgi:beta-aspartyl-peptidase (threonine type)
MNGRSDKSGVVIAIGLCLLLLLVIGGAGTYFVARQRTALAMQLDQARMSQELAEMEAYRARAQAEAAAASRVTTNDRESAAGQADSIRSAIEAVLRAQEDAWNRSDVSTFMDHYWQSESLTFSSGGKITRGWEETLNRYRTRYPTPEKMGRLSFSGLEITPLGDSAALVLGQWNLERESEPVSGNFSLVLRKFDDRWLIVHDHTSQTTD